MPTITSLGIGSGLDINTMVTQLVALERSPLNAMQTRASQLQTQVSSYGKMQSLVSSLQDSAAALNTASLWSRSVATSTDDSAVGVAAGSATQAGNYAVTVQSLAQSQTVVSGKTYASATDVVGSGTLSLQVGSWGGVPLGFTSKLGTAQVDISISATDNLTTLRDKINAAGGGVTATIVTDASGSRLSLRSTSSGVDNGFRVTAADVDGNNTDTNGLSALAYDPQGGSNGMTLAQSAGNAKATINGIAVESSTNELSSAVEGLTLQLRKESTTPVTIGVSSDRNSVDKAVRAFADAFNGLASYIATQTRYDDATKFSGPLQGDAAATGIQGQLRGLLNRVSGASSTFGRLSDVGLQLQRDGTLKVDDTKLSAAIGNLPELKKAFSANNGDSSNDGLARRFVDLTRQMLDSGGSLTTRTEGLRKQISKNTDDQDKLNDRVARFKTRLEAQFTAMDSNMSRLNALSSYVTTQIAAMNKSTR